jgi:hypothetical protein
MSDEMSEVDDGATKDATGPLPAPLRLVSLLTPPSKRREIAAALAEGRLRRLDQIDLLSEDSLRELAPASLYLLLGGGVVFAALDLIAWRAQGVGALLGIGSPFARLLAVVALNVLAYGVMLPLHEALHAATILALGGRPRFGLKLPLAAYCTAPGQIFRRNGYLAVALAPFIILSVLGAAATWIWPQFGACIVLGLAGNVSGAVGDLAATRRILRLPASTLVTDTDTGYVAYAPVNEGDRLTR